MTAKQVKLVEAIIASHEPDDIDELNFITMKRYRRTAKEMSVFLWWRVELAALLLYIE